MRLAHPSLFLAKSSESNEAAQAHLRTRLSKAEHELAKAEAKIKEQAATIARLTSQLESSEDRVDAARDVAAMAQDVAAAEREMADRYAAQAHQAASALAEALETDDGRAALRELFEQLDVDRSGKISAREWAEGMSKRSTGDAMTRYFGAACTSYDEHMRVFERIDLDGDGSLSWDELVAAAAQYKADPNAHLRGRPKSPRDDYYRRDDRYGDDYRRDDYRRRDDGYDRRRDDRDRDYDRRPTYRREPEPGEAPVYRRDAPPHYRRENREPEPGEA